jgi:tetratricopeptide (TPR) repeat protein
MVRHVAVYLLFVCSAVAADLYQEAVAAFQTGRFSDALSILDQLGMDNSNMPAVENLKALAAVELRRYPEALNSIRRALELAPQNPSYAYNHGLILFEARDFMAAKQVFLSALTRFGPNVRLLSGLGETLLRLNEFDEAEKRLRQAAELEPSNAVPRVVAARLYYAIGDRENFRAAAERALSLDPENGEACYYYGLLLIEQAGKPAEGARYIQKSIERDPRFIEGWRAWARILAGQERWGEAARSYERALALDPTDAQSLFLLSRAYRKLGQEQKADEALVRYGALKR